MNTLLHNLVIALLILTFSDVLAKERVSKLSAPARTIVYVYIPTEVGKVGHTLPVQFQKIISSGPALDSNKYWPAPGDTIQAVGPTYSNKSGVVAVAEFSRWTGIENGITYEFTQIVDLPNLGPILKLKQRVLGTALDTKSWIGIETPTVKNAWFDDTDWHRTSINNNGFGTYVITFCSYHWNKLEYQFKTIQKSHKQVNLDISPFGKKSIVGQLVENVRYATTKILGFCVGHVVAGDIDAQIKKKQTALKNYEKLAKKLLLNPDLEEDDARQVKQRLKSKTTEVTHLQEQKQQQLNLERQAQELKQKEEAEQVEQEQLKLKQEQEAQRRQQQLALEEQKAKEKLAALEQETKENEAQAKELEKEVEPEIKETADELWAQLAQQMAEKKAQKEAEQKWEQQKKVIGITTVVAVALGTATIYALRGLPTPYANMVYKIEYIPAATYRGSL